MNHSERKIFVLGAGGHALVVADTLRINNHHVAGYIDDLNPSRKGENFGEAKIIGDIGDFLQIAQKEYCCIVLGFGDCQGRHGIFNKFSTEGIEIISVFHPTAVIAKNTEIEPGAFVGANSVIETGCRIGAGSIVNCNVSICHGTSIGHAVALCPGVSIAGNVNIGNCTWIGIGSSIIENISIGDNCYIGAGSVVIKDIPANTLAYGVPAKAIRKT
jgi:sugar O-acyltransferase (sialic acid O-acetyltransferase NeuD family)